jgi:hypothetical protein
MHYPNIQQLIIKIPNCRKLFDSISILDQINCNIIVKQNISDFSEFTDEILVDSNMLYPGRFVINLWSNNQISFSLYFTKLKDGDIFPDNE